MKTYFVEGAYIRRQVARKARGTAAESFGDVEPYAKAVWALDADDAVRIATEELEGGEWVEGPKVLKTSEEQRMRKLGAPQLPGFGPLIKGKR